VKSDPSDTELKLASKVIDLEDAAMRPVVSGGGLLASAANFLFGKVSRGIMCLCLGLFIAYHSWQAFNSSQQLFADLRLKRAEAGMAVAEAIALNEKSGEKTNARATLESEIRKTQADAGTAEAELEARRHNVDGMSAQLAKVRADIAKAQADADAAKAEADAQNQFINGLPAATAQKKAEVEAAEAQLQSKLAAQKYLVHTAICYARSDVWSALDCN
jgi:hypothetical protein